MKSSVPTKSTVKATRFVKSKNYGKWDDVEIELTNDEHLKCVFVDNNTIEQTAESRLSPEGVERSFSTKRQHYPRNPNNSNHTRMDPESNEERNTIEKYGNATENSSKRPRRKKKILNSGKGSPEGSTVSNHCEQNLDIKSDTGDRNPEHTNSSSDVIVRTISSNATSPGKIDDIVTSQNKTQFKPTYTNTTTTCSTDIDEVYHKGLKDNDHITDTRDKPIYGEVKTSNEESTPHTTQSGNLNVSDTKPPNPNKSRTSTNDNNSYRASSPYKTHLLQVRKDDALFVNIEPVSDDGVLKSDISKNGSFSDPDKNNERNKGVNSIDSKTNEHNKISHVDPGDKTDTNNRNITHQDQKVTKIQADNNVNSDNSSDKQHDKTNKYQSKWKVPLLARNVLHFMVTGKMEKTGEVTTRRRRRYRDYFHSDQSDGGQTEQKPKTHPVKALDVALDKLDNFIKKNLTEETLLYRQQIMPKHFKKHSPLQAKCKTVQQALKMQDLLVCIRERREGIDSEEVRASPDGASVPEAECDCACHTSEFKPASKGKGKGKKSKSKQDHRRCDINQNGKMGCCCSKDKSKQEEIPITSPEVTEDEPSEPEIIIETTDIAIQVDAEEVKNNVIEVKPKKPRFVSVYLEAADESAPRYMLAKNIHHKDRTQYTYIENKEQNAAEPWDSVDNKPKSTKHSSSDFLLNTQSTDSIHSDGSRIILVKESDSSHDFSERDNLIQSEDSNLNSKENVTVSSDTANEDGSKWSRGVDTEELERHAETLAQQQLEEQLSTVKEERAKEEKVHEDLTVESGTGDSGIETIDLDSLSDMDLPTLESRGNARHEPAAENPINELSVYGTPAEIATVKQIQIEAAKGEPKVPRDRGTTIDQEWRLEKLRKIYNPYNIDYSKVRINKDGKSVISPRNKSTSSSSPWTT